MNRLGKLIVFVVILVVGPAAALAASSPVAGTWHKLPVAPVAVQQSLTSVWTGRQLIVLGRTPAVNPSVDVAEAFNPATNTWNRLSPPQGPDYVPGYKAVWTGKEMLSLDPLYSVAYNPATNTWRKLRKSINVGFVAWTGHEAIGWGGGCCGDAQSNGAAYKPATDSFRNLARSPLAPSQGPVGAWDGHELLLFVSGFTPDGKSYPARFARAAAYNPGSNAWRRIARLPEPGGTGVWNGRELLVVGGGAHSQSALAYNPATNRWRRLASLPSGRSGASAVWTGKRLLLWDGENSRSGAAARGGLAYDPRTNRWSVIPSAPLKVRVGSVVAWTGRTLLVWGGEIGTPAGASIPPKYPADGASFTPATP